MSAPSTKTRQFREKQRRLPGRREFQVLEILWDRHPLNVSQIRRLLPASPALAYTTVMTVLEHLYRKGLVLRRKSGRAYLYEPAIGPTQTREALLHAFLTDYFHSDPAQLRNLLGPGWKDRADGPPGTAAAPPPLQTPVPVPERPAPADPPEDEDYLL